MWDAAFSFLWPIAWNSARYQLQPDKFSDADVEDVAVAAIGEVAREIARFESFDHVKAGTAVLAQRRAIDHARKQTAIRRGAGVTESLEQTGEVPDARPALATLERSEVYSLLLDLSRHLNDSARKLLIGYYVQGKTQAELAAESGVPIGTVGVTLSRGLKALRQKLEEHPQLLKELQERSR